MRENYNEDFREGVAHDCRLLSKKVTLVINRIFWLITHIMNSYKNRKKSPYRATVRKGVVFGITARIIHPELHNKEDWTYRPVELGFRVRGAELAKLGNYARRNYTIVMNTDCWNISSQEAICFNMTEYMWFVARMSTIKRRESG